MAGNIASMASDDALMKDDYSSQGRSGRISEISEHGDGKHVNVRVTHGKRKKDKSSGELVGYHNPSSNVTVPKAHAAQYKVGQRVNVGLSPAKEKAPPPKKGAKKKAKGKATSKAPPSRIRSAMKC